MAETAATPSASDTPPVTIKKYANRRLYNTATSSYVTLDHLCQMVKDGVDFVVYDAKTGDDITRQVLTQIIVEEEGKGQNLLPISFMRKLISFYGDNMQGFVPGYLDYSMQTFSRNQERMREYFSKTMGGMFPFDALSHMGQQNWSMLMKMFAPFSPPGQESAASTEAPAASTTPQSTRDYDDLRRRLDELEREIGGIGKK